MSLPVLKGIRLATYSQNSSEKSSLYCICNSSLSLSLFSKIFFKLFIKIPLNWVLVKHHLFFIGKDHLKTIFFIGKAFKTILPAIVPGRLPGFPLPSLGYFYPHQPRSLPALRLFSLCVFQNGSRPASWEGSGIDGKLCSPQVPLGLSVSRF